MMTEEAYKTLQKDYEDVYKMVVEHQTDGSWLKNFLGFESFETKKYVIDDFELESAENYDDIYLKTQFVYLNILRIYLSIFLVTTDFGLG